MLDLAGCPKSGAFCCKEQFLPDTPVIHVVPGQWEAAPTSAVPQTNFSVTAEQCDAGAESQTFDFVPVAAATAVGGAVATRRNACSSTRWPTAAVLQTWPAASPGTNFKSLHGSTVESDNLMWVNGSGGKPTCLDVWANTGPEIDFFACQHGNKNQHFAVNGTRGSV